MAISNFSEVSLLITVYNRSKSLERLLRSLKEKEIVFGEIVVSDDCSTPVHLDRMRGLVNTYGIRLIEAEKNGGLGRNLNKGQRAVTLPYTLYIQEDFVPLEDCADNIAKAFEIIRSDQTIDTIRFYAYFPYPYTVKYDDHFKEMIFKPPVYYWDHLKFYMYSDHPHLRRSSFNDKFGDYLEDVPADVTEFDMCLSYLKKKGRGLIINNFNTTFDQKNNADEPSTIGRKSWKESSAFLIRSMRRAFLLYRFLKNTIQLKIRS